MAKKDAAPQTFKLFPCFHGSTFAKKKNLNACIISAIPAQWVKNLENGENICPIGGRP